MPEFIAYIDESGDDGFVFHPDGSGSSRWFVLSAVVIRSNNDHELRDMALAARIMLGKEEKFPLHFAKLKKHNERIAVCRLMGKTKARCMSVLIHKPSLPRASYEDAKNRLYHYAVRLLLERVSWLCRDSQKSGVFDAELIFSNRAAMSYDELRDYLRLLKSMSESEDVRIDWAAVCPERIRAVQHERMGGLQMADFLASGTRWAAELDRLRVTEFGYLRCLSKVLYRRKPLMSYAFKFFPDFDQLKLANPHLEEFASL